MLKSNINMNTDLRKKQIMILKNIFLIDEKCSLWKNYEKCDRA